MATYYWVGGSGNWDATTTTNWATSSGGAGGAGVPTSADDVIFDANSNTGTGAFTVTVTGTSAAPAVCRDFSTGGAGGALDGAMTLTMGATAFLDVYGSMTLPATNFSISATAGAYIRYRATSTGKTITTNGVSLTNLSISISGVGGEWTLGSALTVSFQIYVNQGTFNTNNFNITAAQFLRQAGNSTAVINLGSSTLSLSQNGTALSLDTTNLTLNAGTSTISCSATSPTFAGGGLTFYNVSFTSTGSGTTQIQGANTFNDLTVASRATTGFKTLQLSANQTVNGTLTLGTANTAIRRIWVASTVLGTLRIITAATVAALSDVDFRDITGAGTGVWSGTRLGDGVGNSGITFDAPKTVYWNLVAGGNWSATAWATTSGGTPNVNNFPLAQDTAIIENTGLNTSATITLDQIWQLGKLDFSTRSNAMTFANGANLAIIYGDVLLSSAVTLTGTAGYAFLSKGTQNLDFAGVTLPQAFSVNNNSTTTKLLSALTATGGATLNNGTLDLNGYDLTCLTFSSSNSNTRSIAFGTKSITTTGSGTVWNTGTVTNFSYTGTPTVNISNNSATATTVTTGALSEAQALNFNYTTGTYTLTDTSSVYKSVNFTGFSGTIGNSARTIYGNLTVPNTVTLTAGTNAITFAATSGTQTITTNGRTLDFPITKQAAGTLTLGDALTMGTTRTFTLTQGTLNLDGKTLSTGLFSSSNSNVRTLNLGANGKITVTGSGTTAWNAGTSTNLTLSGTGTVELTSASAKTFAGGSKVYPYTLNQGGTGTLTITGSNTFEDMTNTVQPTTITFTAGTTTSVKDFSVSGIPGSLVTLNSSSPGTQWNLAKV